MSQYYFATASLPPVTIGDPMEMSFKELMVLLQANLKPEDLHSIRVLRWLFDIRNLRLFWKGEALDPRGVFSASSMEEALLSGEGFPEYVYDFVSQYESTEDRLRYYPQLINTYFRQTIEESEGFLKTYLSFEREWRLVVLGFRAKSLGRDVTRELQFEDPYDEIVAQILAQKDAKVYEPPYGYEDLKDIFQQHYKAPMDLHKALVEYQFRRVEELMEDDLFGMERILAYTVQVILAEKWQEQDEKIGQKIVETILKEAQ